MIQVEDVFCKFVIERTLFNSMAQCCLRRLRIVNNFFYEEGYADDAFDENI
jgi:hypothetical protein